MLDHGTGGVDFSWARDGVPFLLDHNQRVQVGIVEDVRLETDRKVRGLVRMGDHPDAAWVEKDIRKGIRRKISVGYDPGRNYTVISKKDDKIPTRRYTGWRIYEASTVAVPADYDVGVARSAFESRTGLTLSPHGREATEVHMEQNTAPAAGAASVTAGRDYDAERKQRGNEISNIGKLVTDPAKRAELMTQALVEDWAPTRFADEVFRANMATASSAVPAGRIDLTQKEQKQYSVLRALAAGVPEFADKVDAGFEREVSQEISRKTGKSPKGVFIPLSLTADRHAAAMTRASVTGNVSGTTSLGGAGVESSVQDLVEILRAESALIQLGVRYLPGLSGNLTFPRQITANTWTWEGENPSSDKTLTAATLDTFTLSPKTGMGGTAYSKQFLVQSSFSAEQFVREDLGMIAALGIDVAGINGPGTANQPTGVMNISGVETEVMGANGANLAWTNIVSYETKQSVNNAAKGRLGFLLTPGIRGKLKTTLKNTVSGSDYIWGADNTLAGYSALASNQVPSTLTKGTSTTICHGVVFGNWQELIMASWGDALDVTVDPYTLAGQGMVRIIGLAMVDCNARHPKSFVVTKDVLV